MTKKRAQKPYWEMTTEELREATKEFDEEFVADKAKPLTPEMRARWEKARRKLGRPQDGQSEQVVVVRLDQDLLARSDKLAKKLRITRAELIARALRAALSVQGQS